MERTTETHYDPSVVGRKRHDPGTFPEDLRALLEQLGLTQFDGAVLLRMQPRTLGRYLSGATVPHPTQQTGILDALRSELKKRARRKPPTA